MHARLPVACAPPSPQQAKSEIASLSDVTATNAEVMEQELLHHEVSWTSQPCQQGGLAGRWQN